MSTDTKFGQARITLKPREAGQSKVVHGHKKSNVEFALHRSANFADKKYSKHMSETTGGTEKGGVC